MDNLADEREFIHHIHGAVFKWNAPNAVDVHVSIYEADGKAKLFAKNIYCIKVADIKFLEACQRARGQFCVVNK